MVIVIFMCFVAFIASVFIHWQLRAPEAEEHIDLAKNFQSQLDIVDSQYRLHKITEAERERLIAEIENNALKLADEHITRLEGVIK